jgi:thioredoxin reductase (NADPH)
VHTDRGIFKAIKVVLATGYFSVPRMLNIPGENRPNVSHYYDEPFAYSFQKVVIVGAGNSGVEAALELYRHNVDVTLVARGSDIKPTAKYWLVPDLKNRIKEGKISLITDASAVEIGDGFITLDTPSGKSQVDADHIFVLTGYLPDARLLRQCGLHPDPESMLLKFNPNNFESEIEGLYLCGTVLAGIYTEKVFIENGREHAKAIAADILKVSSVVNI